MSIAYEIWCNNVKKKKKKKSVGSQSHKLLFSRSNLYIPYCFIKPKPCFWKQLSNTYFWFWCWGSRNIRRRLYPGIFHKSNRLDVHKHIIVIGFNPCNTLHYTYGPHIILNLLSINDAHAGFPQLEPTNHAITSNLSVFRESDKNNSIKWEVNVICMKINTQRVPFNQCSLFVCLFVLGGRVFNWLNIVLSVHPLNRTYPVVFLLHSQVSGKSIRVLTGAGGGVSGRVVVVVVWGCMTVVVAGGRVPPSSTTSVLKIPGFHLLSERMVHSHSWKSKTIYT